MELKLIEIGIFLSWVSWQENWENKTTIAKKIFSLFTSIQTSEPRGSDRKEGREVQIEGGKEERRGEEKEVSDISDAFSMPLSQGAM